MVIHEKALTRVDQSAERHPAKQEVTGSPPGRGTCVRCMFNPQSGRRQNTTNLCMSLTLMSLSLSLSFSLSSISNYILR